MYPPLLRQEHAAPLSRRCCKEHSQRLLRTSELRDKSTSIEDDAEWCGLSSPCHGGVRATRVMRFNLWHCV
jgi:hypothetical protein